MFDGSLTSILLWIKRELIPCTALPALAKLGEIKEVSWPWVCKNDGL